MAEILVTGSSGFIGKYLTENLDGITALRHTDCDLTDWESVRRFGWSGDVIVHCAHRGIYGHDLGDAVEKNVAMFVNLRRRWPEAKLIAFGSGAMFGKQSPIIKSGEYDIGHPTDEYGLSKKITADLADVTLIPYGLYGDTRFVRAMRQLDPIIYQDVKFSWVNVSDLPSVIRWSVDNGSGRYNLAGYDMSLTELADTLGVIPIIQSQTMGNEYTGRKSIIPLTTWPKD